MKTKIAFVLLLAAAACGRKEPGQTHTVKADVGGAVTFSGDPAIRLGGVLVTLTDLEGNTRTATTSVDGLWIIENVLPGVYIETYELAGYETWSGAFGIDAFGPNDVKNVFVPRPDVGLDERHLRASVSAPFPMVLMDGDQPVDGFGGVTAVYHPAVDGTITATMDRRIIDGNARLIDGETGNALDADRTDTATETVFTWDATQIDQLNGGGGLTTDTDPFTFHIILIENVDAITPLHARFESFDAGHAFNAAP